VLGRLLEGSRLLVPLGAVGSQAFQTLGQRKASTGQSVGVEIFITAARGRLTELRDEIAAERARLIERGISGGDDTLSHDLDRLITVRDDMDGRWPPL
jgi:hypothetical protein